MAAVEPAAVHFDDETLGGYITYARIMAPVHHLTGELKEFVIPDPECSSVLAQTSASAT